MATKKAVKRGPGRPPKTDAPKRRGRPPGSPNKAKGERQQKDQPHAVPIETARVKSDALPDSADLIAALRPHIKAVDTIMVGCVAAGVDPAAIDRMRYDADDLFERMLLALAKAP